VEIARGGDEHGCSAFVRNVLSRLHGVAIQCSPYSLPLQVQIMRTSVSVSLECRIQILFEYV